MAAAIHQGVDLTYIHSHFLQLAVAAFIISLLLSVYLYMRSRNAPVDLLALGGNSGMSIPFCSYGLKIALFPQSYELVFLIFLQAMWLMTFSKDGSSTPASGTLI